MMQECYGVNGWEYDRDLNVQFTNSKSPNLQKLLLLGFDRDKAILEHAATSDVPMIISDNLGLMWGIVEEKTGKPENIGDFYVLGPVVNKEFTTQMISGTSKVEQQESNFAIGDRVHKYYGFKYLAIKHGPKIEKKHCVVCSHVNGLSEDTCWNCKNKLVDINV